MIEKPADLNDWELAEWEYVKNMLPEDRFLEWAANFIWMRGEQWTPEQINQISVEDAQPIHINRLGKAR